VLDFGLAKITGAGEGRLQRDRNDRHHAVVLSGNPDAARDRASARSQRRTNEDSRSDGDELRVAALRSASWNQMDAWLRSIDALRRAA
jgi:hypothetical protein